ncbi:MAG: 4Fe-4S binding protein [Fibrobacter sp.]|nr:4Fe-4S binding protein [Fibrobacter sp.]
MDSCGVCVSECPIGALSL